MKKIILPIIIIVIIGVVVIVLINSNQNSDVNANKLTTQNSKQVNTSSTLEINWKEYKNSSLELSINMPTNWYVRTSENNVIVNGLTDVSYRSGEVSLESSPKPLFRSSGAGPKDESRVSLQGIAFKIWKEIFSGKSLDEYLNSFYGAGEWRSNQVTIGKGIAATQVEFTGGFKDYSVEYYFINNNFLYHVGIIYEGVETSPIVSEILSSIEFNTK